MIEFMPNMNGITSYFDCLNYGGSSSAWKNLIGNNNIEMYNPVITNDGIEFVGNNTSYGKLYHKYDSNNKNTTRYLVCKNLSKKYANWKTILDCENTSSGGACTVAMGADGFFRFCRHDILDNSHNVSELSVVAFTKNSSGYCRLWINGDYIAQSKYSNIGWSDYIYFARGSTWKYEDNNTLFKFFAIADVIQSDAEILANSQWLYEKYILGKFDGFLIKDNTNLKAIKDEKLITIGPYPPSIDLFREYGMDKETINSILSDRNNFEDTKPKILYYTNKENSIIPSLNEIGTPYGQIVEQKQSIDFNKSYINNIKNITITASKGNSSILKFIVSKDDGISWLTFNGADWISTNKEKIDIIENGMDLEVINKLSEEQLKIISDTKKIKFAWYMKRASLEENVIIKNLKLDYNTDL